MYLAIDVGGSKTLLAVFSSEGKIIDSFKLPTNKSYPVFLSELSDVLKTKLGHYNFLACCCALPALIDRKAGVGLSFGNLSWKNVPIRADLKKLLAHIDILVENDAKLAGLAEALSAKAYRKVLYITVSTGIGAGLIIDGKIDSDFYDSEPGQMMLEHDGKIQKWEDFASGRALVAKYGKRADEIEDAKTWKEFSRGLALGMNELIAILKPDVIIIGGGVGAHFERFKHPLLEELEKLENSMVETPPIRPAKHAEEAVIYGCYNYIKANH